MAPFISICAKMRRGVTLIELLVVAIVVALLAAMFLMSSPPSSYSRRRNTCSNNEIQLTRAILDFESGHRQFPGSWMSHTLLDGKGEQTVNWLVELLPYLERIDLYRCFENSPPSFGNPTRAPYQSILICPDSGITVTNSMRTPISYIVNCGRPDDATPDTSVPLDYAENGVFFNQTNYGGTTAGTGTQYPPVRQTLKFIAEGDGASHTLLLSETVEPIYWYDGSLNPPIPQEGSPAVSGGATEFMWGMLWFGGGDSPLQWDRTRRLPKVALNGEHGGSQGKTGRSLEAYARPSSVHRGGFTAFFCDGHYRFISDSIDYRVYCHLMTPRGNESRNPGTDELTFRGYPDAGKGAWLRSADPPELIPLRDEEY